MIDNETDYQLKVTGVFKNPPTNSRFQSPVIGSFATHYFAEQKNLNWGNASFETYFLLNKNTDASVIDSKLEELLISNIPEEDNRWFSLHIKPLGDLHLYMGDVQDSVSKPGGDIAQVKIVMVLGLIVLLIAVVNYVNLSTAQSQKRFKEVGVSKTLGASREQLIGQFFLETSFYVFVAIFLALQITLLFIPAFNNITQKNIDANKGKFKDDGKQLLGDYITNEELWACTTCNACVEECPVSINPLSIILEMRRYLVMEQSAAPMELNNMMTNIENNGAPWPYNQMDRLNWKDEA